VVEERGVAFDLPGLPPDSTPAIIGRTLLCSADTEAEKSH